MMDHQQWLEQHDRMIADHDRGMADLRLQAAQDQTDRTLRRAIRLAVQDARRQCRRNQEFDDKMTQIASAQLANEQLLKAFLERAETGSAQERRTSCPALPIA